VIFCLLLDHSWPIRHCAAYVVGPVDRMS
jgi:hypothetical protein